MLLSARDGGMPQPLEATTDPRADPVLACLAVRFAGYWAEGLATITAKPTATLAAANAALTAMLREIRPGAAAWTIAAAASRSLAGMKIHPFVASGAGNGIGLSRDEAPFLRANDPSLLQEGDVCAIRSGAQAGDADSAIASAMIRVGPSDVEVLWR